MNNNTKKSITTQVEKIGESLVVREQDLSPEKTGKKYTLVNAPISNEQILKIFQRTPAQHVHQRPGKGGGTWDFVTGVYVKKVLNHVFGWLWDFEIMDKGKEGKQVWVQGKLTIKDPKTFQPVIIKTQFGGADIKFKKGTSEMLDYANDLKAATTDALKKCASELGIASDIYGKNEFKEIGAPVETKDIPLKKNTPVETKTTKTYLQQLKERLVLKTKSKNETDNLIELEHSTGIHWETFKGKSESQAQQALAKILQSNLNGDGKRK